MHPDALTNARALLAAAQSVTVLTGAGISAESGIPTFRDAMTGLWSRFRPEDLATPEAFARDPKTVWDWYAMRRDRVAAAEPNAGHRALVELEAQVGDFTLITQNVDGLHARAGSRNVIELHGNIARTKCFDCGQPLDEASMRPGSPPSCVHCGGRARPDVVWFNESLPQDAFTRAVKAAHGCDLFLAIGTSAVVEPAASLPLLALRSGAGVIEVNPTETPLTDHVSVWLEGAAGMVLPELVRSG